MASNTSGKRSIKFCIGDSVIRSLGLNSPTYQYTLTTTGVSVMPAVGDEYLQGSIQLYVFAVSGSTISFATAKETDSLSSTGTVTKVVGSGDNSITYTAKTASKRVNLTGATCKFSIIKDPDLPPTGTNLILSPVTLTISSATNGLVTLYLTPIQTSTLPTGSYKGVFQVSYGTAVSNESLNSQCIPVLIDDNKIT